MKRRLLCALLALLLLASMFAGCGSSGNAVDKNAERGTQQVEITEATEETVPATIPADGNPDDVTCKGSYTSESANADVVVATVGEAELTNAQLQILYWMEVASYRQAEKEIAPDFDRPLDTQTCEIDDSVASWQQYFLQRALNTWHSAQALVNQGEDEGLPVEEAYQPNLTNYEIYLTDIPATKYLYRYSGYEPNSMHQAYLDSIPEMLEQLAQERGYSGADAMAQAVFGASAEDTAAVVRLYNQGYMYLTNLSYYVEAAAEEVEAYFAENEAAYAAAGVTRDSGSYVDIRHIRLVPEAVEGETVEPIVIGADGSVTCSEAAWEACLAEAEALLATWRKGPKVNEAAFAELANEFSDDPGTALDGGAYRRIRQGQLLAELDEWCFDEARVEGDVGIIRSDYGYHILYFSGSTDIWYAEAEEDLKAQKQAELIFTAREKYPVEIDYSAITLTEAEAAVSADDVLYPDVAHERFPEAPVYLQQDYPKTMYGGYKITTNGCGITTMAMLATYMSDDELTPPEMCARYGNYSHSNGTDGMIFNYEPAAMGFYLKEKTYEPSIAKAALEEGYVVVSIQHAGYWTRGGHYILLEKITEDGMVQVRDSNIYNYGKLAAHKQDLHTWNSITANGSGYWIFEKKVTYIPACSRCGEPEGVVESLLNEEYLCEKCQPALLRRSTYLSACGD